LFNERVLPDLSRNIKCGNSLIGTDFYVQGTLGLSEDEQYKINAFDWETEFADVFKDGGFDAVIGNPPYVRIHEMSQNEKKFYADHYVSASNQFDLYQLFYEKGLTLLKESGRLGFITSNKFCITQYGRKLRELIFDNYDVELIADVSGLNVFKDASTYPYILVIGNSKTKDNKTNIQIVESVNNNVIIFGDSRRIKQSALLSGDDKAILLTSNKNTDLLKKIESVSSSILAVYRGRGTTVDLSEIKKKNTVPAITNRQIRRFVYNNEVLYKDKDKYANDFSPKLLMKKICFDIEVAIDEEGNINPINTVYVIKSNDNNISLKFILGVLCSRPLTYYARTKYLSTHMRGGYIELRVFEVEKLPIPIIDFSKKSDKARYDKLIALVEQMLDLKKKEQTETVPQTKTMISRQIQAVDKQIDTLVYDLYGLTEDEIKVVEGER
jgi:ribosomal protein L30E